MDEKISLKAVDQYSEAYAAKTVSVFFGTKQRITGPEILTLCDLKQINLFTIRELMHAWKVENQKLKSPYFDYQAKEVVQAMQHFQNTVSNHILIPKEDFTPLLRRAVRQTLYLLLAPYDFYSETLDRQGRGSIRVEDLKNDIKYLKINRPPLENLVQKLEAKKISALSGNEAFALLDSILEEVNFTPEDVDVYLDQFSRVVPLEVEKLYVQNVSPKPAQEATHSNEKKPNRVAAVAPSQKSAINNFQKINRIKDSLTINQKFMFTKILFKGDFEIFTQAIDRLETFDDLTQALRFLETQYPDWDKETEECQEFLSLVEQRFSQKAI